MIRKLLSYNLIGILGIVFCLLTGPLSLADQTNTNKLEKINFSNGHNIEGNTNNVPDNYALFQNYPNPFNPTTKISYQIPKESYVSLKVYDLIGNEVSDLVAMNQPAGIYEVEFNAKDLPSGIYFYRLKADDFVSVKKLMVMK